MIEESNAQTTPPVEINPNWSEPYQKALKQGKKGVLYICDLGLDRSCKAVQQAINNGEQQSFFLNGGLKNLIDRKSSNVEDQLVYFNALREIANNYYLRFVTEESGFRNFDQEIVIEDLNSMNYKPEEHFNFFIAERRVQINDDVLNQHSVNLNLTNHQSTNLNLLHSRLESMVA